MRVAVVVAHPDDEVLWFGELIRKLSPDIYCCMTPKQDPRRAVAFFDVCKKVGSRPVLLPDFEFYWIDLSPYDAVVTHNYKGEYGHKDHVRTHDYVVNNFDGQVICSGYGLDGNAELEADQDKIDLIKTYNYPWRGEPRYSVLFRNWGSKFNLLKETYIV
jgi:hypothetical protein